MGVLLSDRQTLVFQNKRFGRKPPLECASPSMHEHGWMRKHGRVPDRELGAVREAPSGAPSARVTDLLLFCLVLAAGRGLVTKRSRTS